MEESRVYEKEVKQAQKNRADLAWSAVERRLALSELSTPDSWQHRGIRFWEASSSNREVAATQPNRGAVLLIPNAQWCCREEVLEFAIGGDLVDKEDEQIDVEVWDYHWVNKPGNLTWYDEWYRALLYMRSPPVFHFSIPARQHLVLISRLKFSKPTRVEVFIP